MKKSHNDLLSNSFKHLSTHGWVRSSFQPVENKDLDNDLICRELHNPVVINMAWKPESPLLGQVGDGGYRGGSREEGRMPWNHCAVQGSWPISMHPPLRDTQTCLGDPWGAALPSLATSSILSPYVHTLGCIISEPNPQPCSDMPASSSVRVASRGPWPLHPLPVALPFCITTTPSLGPHPIWFRCCCTQTFLPTRSCLSLHRVLTAPHSLKLAQSLQSSFSPAPSFLSAFRPGPQSCSKFPDSVPTITLPGQAPGPAGCPPVTHSRCSCSTNARQLRGLCQGSALAHSWCIRRRC